MANRVDQAYTNFIKTFPFFATVVLAAHLIDRHTALTLWGAQLYFWGRLGYVLAAAAGYEMIRSAFVLQHRASWDNTFLNRLLQ